MAIEFEKKYTKRQILEMYFNEIYYGNGAMGIAQAARLYFNKSAEELNDGECLMLAGVPKNPGRYNPLGKPADVAARRDVVLKRLVDLKIITARQSQVYRTHPARVQGPGEAPYYLAQVRDQLVERYGPDAVEQGGLDVTAALDLHLQRRRSRPCATGSGGSRPTCRGRSSAWTRPRATCWPRWAGSTAARTPSTAPSIPGARPDRPSSR